MDFAKSWGAHLGGPFVLVAALSACSAEDPVEDADGVALRQARVEICHFTGHGAHVIEVAYPALAAHLRHGDHLARLWVDPHSTSVGDGVHFARITDALEAVRKVRLARGESEEAACSVAIEVAPGTYRGTYVPGADDPLEAFPLLIDFPGVALDGSFAMGLDSKGRANGVSATPGTESILVADTGMSGDQSLVFVASPWADGTIRDVAVRGFVFRNAPGAATAAGAGLLTLRVDGLDASGNRFEPGLAQAIDERSSSGVLAYNASTVSSSCSFCIAGPGDFLIHHNSVTLAGSGAIVVSPVLGQTAFSLGAHTGARTVAPYVLPPTARATTVISDNLLANNAGQPNSFGVRVGAIGRNTTGMACPPVVGPDGKPGHCQEDIVDLWDNEIVGNPIGLAIDAAFLAVGALDSGMVVTLDGNTFDSCKADLFVSFGRYQMTLPPPTASTPYLVGSSYRIDLGSNDDLWDGMWIDHPSGKGNTLSIEGHDTDTCQGAFLTQPTQPSCNGRSVFYNPDGTCP